MSEREVAPNIMVEICGRCGCAFFDARELRAFRAASFAKNERGRDTRRRSRWTGELLHCPNCDTLSLRRGRRGRVEIAHCVDCQGFLLPSLRAARSPKLVLETRPEEVWSSSLHAMGIDPASLVSGGAGEA